MIGYERYNIPGGVSTVQVDVALIVPYVEGMLRDETLAVLDECDEAYFTFPIDAADPYQYAELFRQLWDSQMTTLWIEHDMVPTTGQIKELIYCDHDWCTMRYHQGGGMYTDGIGFAKFSKALKDTWPNAGTNIAADPKGRERAVMWPGLNEAVERHLSRLGVEMHVHDGTVVHLHHPEDDNG